MSSARHQLGGSSIKAISVILYEHYLIKTVFRLKITSSYVEVLQSFQRYEVYPAISDGMRVLKDASSSPERIFRQGIVVKTTDTGDWFYIGGISPYWTSDQLIVYQGGSQASSQGKLNRGIIDDFVNKGGLGVVPLYKERAPSVWYNPVLFKDCQGSSGIFWNTMGRFYKYWYKSISFRCYSIIIC